jgi:glyceraldehyde 3-phosphate dehydrogenase
MVGINEADYDGAVMHVVSCASCTTHALAPLAAVVDAVVGIEEGAVCVIHAVTASQKVCDGVPKPGGSHRSGRAANNIVPAATGAAASIGRLLPRLHGRLICSAWRVPVQDVSVLDLVVRTERPTSLANVMAALRAAAADGPLRTVLRVEEQERVSSDFVGEAASCVVDAHSCAALGERMLKLTAWFDNEGAGLPRSPAEIACLAWRGHGCRH